MSKSRLHQTSWLPSTHSPKSLVQTERWHRSSIVQVASAMINNRNTMLSTSILIRKPLQLHASGLCPPSRTYIQGGPQGQHHYTVLLLLSPLSPFHWLQNTWHWMMPNGHFALNSVLRWYVWILRSLAFEATLKLVVNVVGTLNRKEQLRHRAVSLRQHGFLVTLQLLHTQSIPINGGGELRYQYHLSITCPTFKQGDC